MDKFTAKWITDREFYALKPRNVFHRQLEPIDLPCDEHRNRHILFRKKFLISKEIPDAKIYISADDYYKLYINGRFVCQGPTPSYHFRYNYNVLDVSSFLIKGENTIAVHTLYQGLVNRVWQSGDNRHGLFLELTSAGKVLVASDETFKTMPHSGYKEISISGYDTQFLEEYDSRSSEVGFESPAFDDSDWQYAKYSQYADYTLKEQESAMLVFEKVAPISQVKKGNCLQVDFGSNYAGYICMKIKGKCGDVVTIRCGQELNEDGSLRYELRANCKYEESWILADGISTLDQFDYKAFRYAEFILPEGCEVKELYMNVRHYPFELKTDMKKEFADNQDLRKIWDLCVHTQKYGAQETFLDCMEREKGFYMGDGIWTILTNTILTKDDTLMRKLIDDSFSSDFITDGLVTCLNSSLMQEIAESPLMLTLFIWWHYRLTGDKEYLSQNFTKIIKVIESYRRDYETDGLLNNLDKWCVVEWPPNFRDGYDVDVKEGAVCTTAHVVMNSYYLAAIKMANKMSIELKGEIYRDEKPLTNAFISAFYNKKKHLFKDSIDSEHISIVGNTFPFAFGLCPDEECAENIMNMYSERKISSVFLSCTFNALMGFVRYGNDEKIKELMLDDGAWLRMLKEGATTTFEGWGRDSKWNTSLFHPTMSYGALFLADTGLKKILD